MLRPVETFRRACRALWTLLVAFGLRPFVGIEVQDAMLDVKPHVPEEPGMWPMGNALSGLKPGPSKAKPPNMQLTPDDLHDPHDPRGADFEPRRGPDEGGHEFVFGHVHAALRHVIKSTKAGDLVGAAEELEAFSAKHDLGLSVGSARAAAVEAAVKKASAEKKSLVNKSTIAAASQAHVPTEGLHVLVLGAGMGSSALRCLPALLENGTAPDSPHELVSIEGDMHVSDTGSQLLTHALGEKHQNQVRHLPLLPAEDTSLAEVLDSLRDGYELGPFDLVLLEGRDRKKHIAQLQTLVEKNGLRSGAVVHAEGPGRGDAGTEKFLEILESSDGPGRFDYEIHDRAWPGAAAVIATHRGGYKAEL